MIMIYECQNTLKSVRVTLNINDMRLEAQCPLSKNISKAIAGGICLKFIFYGKSHLKFVGRFILEALSRQFVSQIGYRIQCYL